MYTSGTHALTSHGLTLTHELTHTRTCAHRPSHVHTQTYSQALTQSHTHTQALTHSHTCIHTCVLRHPYFQSQALTHTYTFPCMYSHSRSHTLSLACTHTRKFNRGSGTRIFELPFLPLFPCCRAVPPHPGLLSFREAGHTLQPSPELLANSFQSSLCARREQGESSRWARPVPSHSLPLILSSLSTLLL